MRTQYSEETGDIQEESIDKHSSRTNNLVRFSVRAVYIYRKIIFPGHVSPLPADRAGWRDHKDDGVV